jgi:serine/threonine protein kinase
MPRRLDHFVADLARSGLLTVEQSDAALDLLTPPEREAPDAAATLARHLITRGDLTTYQARKLLAGVTRGFFLAGYRILRHLGEGGMGKVYLAIHEKDRRRVAIKVLPPKKALESEQALKRFRREMDLSQRVNHPNLARTLEVGQVDNIHFMVMEYIPGDSLFNLVKKPAGGPLRVPDAARYFSRALEGLAAAHSAGLIHRDIKPSNLMVTPDGDAKVLDMGLARAMGDENPLTRPNVVIGTLDYASPEQLSDAATADVRSDLYSMGCTIYFALAGRPPFEGGDVVNKIYKQRMEDPEPLEQAARGVPAAFAAIVRKLMAKEPADRYQSADELRADLLRWTDPAVVKAILGSEAEAARAFRPPPPELDDDDLVLLDDPTSPSTINLRNLGEAEPSLAPRHKLPPPPRPAIIRPYDDDSGQLPTIGQPSRSHGDDRSWLLPFIAFMVAIGLLAILLIAVLK